MTKRLRECGDLIGVDFLDHIIIGDGKYVSLKEMNYI
ncbi:DNA repair protein RadC [Jeotgalicoccus aerolatus]|uniref:DNA repair protein RadC n=1 Tax=Jeotgalicoccus aerolatus TaxID=709510 RepID=A0ABS4HLV1_9STAP|nr:DNA repair protein RadC [Jeotgalicoccus aerolatus]